jgi:hypothetical protein
MKSDKKQHRNVTVLDYLFMQATRPSIKQTLNRRFRQKTDMHNSSGLLLSEAQLIFEFSAYCYAFDTTVLANQMSEDLALKSQHKNLCSEVNQSV